MDENENVISSNSIWLSTIDNPYNPITQFREWFEFDTVNQYNSCNVLAKFARISNDLTEQENFEEIDSAIGEIMQNDATKMFCKLIIDENGVIVDTIKQDNEEE